MLTGPEKSVVISLWSAGSCGRKQLAGILRYVNSGKRWNTRFIMDPSELTAEAIRRFEREAVDGFIAFVSDPAASKALAASKVPTVLLSFPTVELKARKSGIVSFVNDNAAIGCIAAEHFLTLGKFSDYGFVPDRLRRGWSSIRGQAFARRLREDGRHCRVFSGGEQNLVRWLTSLRHPAAIMAPFDFRAREVISACNEAGLSVPDEIAVLGVDDDELICESSRPALSSIGIDQEAIGYKAAEVLSRLMNAKRQMPSKTIVIKSGPVVVRESTRQLAPVVGLVRRIDAFLNGHWQEPISIGDIASSLHVSRRLIDLRYRKASGCTIREALERRRMEALKRMLATTDMPIAKLTNKCGFANELWTKYIFKRKIGMTMSQYRKASRS